MAQLRYYIEKFGFKKVYWVTVAFLLLLGILNSIVVDRAGNHFTIDGNTFVYVTVDNHLWTFKDEQGKTLKVFTENRQYNLKSDTALYLNYGETHIKRVSNLEDFSSQVYNGDKLVYSGDLFPFSSIRFGPDDEMTPSIPNIFELKLIEGVLKVASHVQSGLFINFLLMSTIFILLGTAQVACPEYLWQLRHFIDVKGGEPTSFYLMSTRVMGIVMTVFGVFLPWVFWGMSGKL